MEVVPKPNIANDHIKAFLDVPSTPNVSKSALKHVLGNFNGHFIHAGPLTGTRVSINCPR